jgi:hypothetical protein
VCAAAADDGICSLRVAKLELASYGQFSKDNAYIFNWLNKLEFSFCVNIFKVVDYHKFSALEKQFLLRNSH